MSTLVQGLSNSQAVDRILFSKPMAQISFEHVKGELIHHGAWLCP